MILSAMTPGIPKNGEFYRVFYNDIVGEELEPFSWYIIEDLKKILVLDYC